MAQSNSFIQRLTATLGIMALCLSAMVRAAIIERVNVATPTGEPFSEDIIESTISSVPGTEFSPVKLSADIQKLYKSGFVSTVEAKVDELGNDKVAITFLVQAVPRVRDVIIEGNQTIKNRTIKREITIEKGMLLNPKMVADNTLAIRQVYDKKGYYETKITSAQRPVEGRNEIDVVFKITETPRYKVRDVNFIGTSVFTERQLRKLMQTRRSFWSWIFAAGFFSAEKLEYDIAALAMAYADKGYVDFRVAEIEKNISDNDKWITITLHIEEGSAYTVSASGISGNKLFGSAELLPLLNLTSGVAYSPTIEGRDIRAIQNKYRPLGYVDMICRPRIDKNTADHTVSIDYQITEGVPARIRDIYISGNVVTRDEVIRRELRLLPGDLADSNKIETSKAVLNNLNYFSKVIVNTKSTEVEALKDLEIEVEEKRTGQLMLGAGFSSEDALVGTFEVTQTNFDWRNWPRLTGDGQRMRLRLQLGTERDDFTISFVEPWWFDRRLRLELNAFRSMRDQNEYLQENTGADMTVSRQWLPKWRQSLGLRLQQISLSDFEGNATKELLAEDGSYMSTALLFSLTRDSRDRFINPTRGSRVLIHAELQPELLGSYSTVYRLGLSGTKYLPVADRWVLKLNGELGVVDKVSGDPVAIFDRYFAGGSNSLRGFDRREISPVDANEDPLGGQSLMLASAEMTYRFTKVVSGSVFCDTGNVWSGSYDWDPADVNVSVGVGLQFDLPVGPIRLDYGFPIVTQEDHLDGGGRLHFNLGYFF